MTQLLPLLALVGCDIFVDLGGKPGDTDDGDPSVDTADASPGDSAGLGDTGSIDTSACAGGDAAWVLSTGIAWPTVQAAIDAAGSGDTVRVCPGTWTGNLVLSTGPLTLAGYGADRSALDGGGVGRVLDVPTGGTATVRDLTVQGGLVGDMEKGGGLRGVSADVSLTNVVFTGNTAYMGGAVSVEAGSTLTVDGGTFTGNTSASDGGAVMLYMATLGTFTDTTFTSNTSNGSYGGGGVMVYHTTAELDGCTFDANQGAAIAGDSDRDLTITGSRFEDNVSQYQGGALYYLGSDGATVTITDSTFVGNRSDSGGGAIHLDEGPLRMSGSTFEDNHSGSSGGAIELDFILGDTSIAGSTFTGNTATSEGGAIVFDGKQGYALTIATSAFSGNDAYIGGALSLDPDQATVTLDTCTLDGNTAFVAGGISSDAGTGATIVITGGAVTRNAADFSGALNPYGEGTITVTDSDWGSDATDNSPDDIGDNPAFGAHATFSCTGHVCH